MGAKVRPVARRQSVVLETVAVLEQQQPAFVDVRGLDRGCAGRLAARVSDEQRVVEQGYAVDVAAGEGKGEQHAVELTTVERVARSAAGLFAEVKLELGPLLAQ